MLVVTRDNHWSASFRSYGVRVSLGALLLAKASGTELLVFCFFRPWSTSPSSSRQASKCRLVCPPSTSLPKTDWESSVRVCMCVYGVFVRGCEDYVRYGGQKTCPPASFPLFSLPPLLAPRYIVSYHDMHVTANVASDWSEESGTGGTFINTPISWGLFPSHMSSRGSSQLYR